MALPDTSDNDERLHAMEERLTFQQRVIDELNEVVLHHEHRLEQLSREVARFAASLQRLADSSPGEDLPHEKPPHY
jgi:uncharacterized coiled-coil protein SlyX